MPDLRHAEPWDPKLESRRQWTNDVLDILAAAALLAMALVTLL